MIWMRSFLLAVLVPFGAALAQSNFNLVQNPDFEDVPLAKSSAEPPQTQYCPDKFALSLGIPGVTYVSSNPFLSIPEPSIKRAPPWLGTHSEFFIGQILRNANNCNSGYLFPDFVDGNGGSKKSYPPNHEDSAENQVFAGVWASYNTSGAGRTEYLNGLLYEAITPGIEYDVNYDFSMPSRAKIGFKKLGVLFYNNQVSSNSNYMLESYVHNNIRNFAIAPKVVTSNDLPQFGFSLTDNLSMWQASGANLFISEKQGNEVSNLIDM